MKPIVPVEALSQHVAVLGKTGSGKSYAVKGIVEWLLDQHRRVGIVDPTGAWWGLRSSRDGTGPGFPILVLGGDHGDLPLPAAGGTAVARLLAEQGVNLVADTSQLTVGERTRWFIDFASTLYRINRSPLHLVLDEAHNFAPQGRVPDPDTGRMLHAANTLASGGRSRGIRLAMITQRPQKLHKDALTSADTLVAMRLLAPQDRGAVKEWIDGCADPAQGKEVLGSLASLARGEGWVWYPEGSFLARMQFPAIRTFDSSATPVDGAAVAAPRSLAEIDLTEIRASLDAAVSEAEASDPKHLRAVVADLKAELARRDSLPQDVGNAFLSEAEQRGYHRGVRDGYDAAARHLVAGREMHVHALDQRFEPMASPPSDPAYHARATPVARAPGSPELPIGEAKVLTAIAQHRDGVTREQITVLTGYKRSSRDTYLQRLGARGLLDVQRSGTIVATAAGTAALGADFKPLPKGAALRRYWLDRLPVGEKRVLEVVTEAWPKAVDRDAISRATDYKRSSRDTYLQRLSARQLVVSIDGGIRASEVLFK